MGVVPSGVKTPEFGPELVSTKYELIVLSEKLTTELKRLPLINGEKEILRGFVPAKKGCPVTGHYANWLYMRIIKKNKK